MKKLVSLLLLLALPLVACRGPGAQPSPPASEPPTSSVSLPQESGEPEEPSQAPSEAPEEPPASSSAAEPPPEPPAPSSESEPEAPVQPPSESAASGPAGPEEPPEEPAEETAEETAVATTANPTPEEILERDADADFFVLDGLVYLDVSEEDWVAEKITDMEQREELGKILRSGVTSQFHDWDATRRAVGSVVYATSEPMLVFLVEDDMVFVFMKLVEG